MITVEFKCDHIGCQEELGNLETEAYAAEESVDVIAVDWHGRANPPHLPRLLQSYLPEGWRVRQNGDPFTAEALVYCPAHVEEHP